MPKALSLKGGKSKRDRPTARSKAADQINREKLQKARMTASHHERAICSQKQKRKKDEIKVGSKKKRTRCFLKFI